MSVLSFSMIYLGEGLYDLAKDCHTSVHKYLVSAKLVFQSATWKSSLCHVKEGHQGLHLPTSKHVKGPLERQFSARKSSSLTGTCKQFALAQFHL